MTTFRLRGLSRPLGLNPRRRATPDAGPPGDTEAPSVPQNLVATAVSSSQIDLTWDASTDNVAVTGYNIYRDDVLVDTRPTNSYSDTGLDPGTEYEYEVSAFDAASNESARSAPDSATTHQAIVTDGLVAEWRFDEGAGQVLTDYSGNGNHGTLGANSGSSTDDPTWTPQGLSFDGGDFVGFAGNLGVSGTQARSVIFVANTTGANRFAAEWIGNGTNGRRWTLRDQASGDELRLEIAGAGHTSALALTNAWRFFACTQAGANINTGVLYLDGSAAAIPTSATIDTTGNFSITTLIGAPYGNPVVAYGLVYNRALTPAEVEQNRAALKSILAARSITLP